MKSKLMWESRYNTGIRSIDLQHRELVEMINDLKNLPDEIPDAVNLSALIQRLSQYIVFHFGHEESLMGSSRVPLEHRRTHALEHAAFARELDARIDRTNGGIAPVTRVALVEYLKSWLLDHILKTDVELAGYVGVDPHHKLKRPESLLRGPYSFNLRS